ncbi:MAG: histidine phosphatase family protein [Candidatus Gracilibacteria bacterium]|nr:histidine phosphatase family protein [Candidatus Gracilibacteria bacterium]
MLIYIFSHAKSIANTQKIVEGHGDSKLCLVGYIQSFFLFLKLLGKKFAVIYSSDLERGYRTAQISCMTNNIIKKKELRERYLGINEGKHIDDECWGDLVDDGESNYECGKRLEKFIKSLDEKNNNIIVFTHGRIISNYISIIKGYNKENGYKKVDNIKNCGLIILELNNGKILHGIKPIYERLKSKQIFKNYNGRWYKSVNVSKLVIKNGEITFPDFFENTDQISLFDL